ncbi:MarR family protein [Paraburkholderia sp. BL6665CI2N2]|uniref:AAA family ATPase n=1 Tax=Paraburkholderia sp. BL6665CI2N2 TaxID=1938806 RepID=UPI00106589B5|nr:AAA family ATPase [Paraburkholderia sp. BL6665CI2N2]TDY26126.1 MarR family protein [Paraburkholderia sp. BL6665CI2N2]
MNAERDVPGSVDAAWYATQIECNGNRREQREVAQRRAAKAIAKANGQMPDASGKTIEIWEPEIVMTDTLLAAPPTRPKFVIDGLLPTGLTYLAGRPKQGKSLLALQMTVAVASGQPLWGRDVDAGRCWYIDVENARWRVHDRLQQAGIDTAHVPNLAWTFEWRRGNRNALTAALDRMPVKMLVTDTWPKFRPPLDKRQDQYEQEGEELAWLAHEANERAMSIVCVGHTTKSDLGDVYSQIGGSTAVAGGADALFVLRKEADDRRVLHTTGRDIADSRFMLRLGEDLQFRFICDADAMVTDEQLAYLRAIANGAGLQNQVAQALGVSYAAVSKMVPRLLEAGLVRRPGGMLTLTVMGRQIVDTAA